MVHNSTIFPALKMSSSGIGMVGMLGRLMLTLPSEPASLDPDLDQSWGWGTSSRARKSYTVFIPDFLFRMGFRRNVSLSHLIEADNLSQCAQCPLPDKGNLPWILSVSPSHHRIPSPNLQAAPTTNRKLYFQNVKRTASLREIKHDHQTTNID